MVRLIFIMVVLFTSANFAAAEVTLTDVYGNNTSIASLKGKWIFINYWATWCQPCVDEINQLNQFYHKNKKNVAVFAVNFDFVPLEEQIQLIKKLHIEYPSLPIDPGAALNLEPISGVPVTFVFNPQGQLAHTLYGGQTSETFEQALH